MKLLTCDLKMWAKPNYPLAIIRVLVILQIAYGKPIEVLVNRNITSSLVEIDREVEANSSFLETASVLLTVLSPNDTTSSVVIANSTMEPDYDDYNSTSSTLNDLEDDLLDNSTMNSSTESSSTQLSQLITEEMEVADSLDESVTVAMRKIVREDHPSVLSTSLPSTEDDSIIIASMGSSLHRDTVQSLFTHGAIATTEAVESFHSSEESSSISYSSSESSDNQE